MNFESTHLNVIHRSTDEYHAVHIVDPSGGLVSPLPLHEFVRSDTELVNENLGNSRWLRRHNVWEVTNAAGRHRGYVHRSGPPYNGLVLVTKLLKQIMSYTGIGHTSVEREAAIMGLYLSRAPRSTVGMTARDAVESASFDALMHATPESAAPFRLRALFDPDLPQRLAWLPGGFTVQGTQVVWHPAPPEEPTADW